MLRPSLVFLMNADVLFVQAHFSSESTAYYSAVAIVGVGLVSFTMPMAAVMFPKLVRSVAQSQKTDSLMLAVSGTFVLGLVAVLLCSAFPTLPLRILHYKNPKLWESSQLIPWFMWSMLPMTLANVMVGSLLARRDFRAVPLFVAITAAYGFELTRYLGGAEHLPMFDAYKGVILRIGLFSSLVLLVAIIFSWRPPRKG